jgi:hypothetical protein
MACSKVTPGLNQELVVRVQKLFDSLDPVKFARVIPSSEEALAIHREARELITSTRKVSVDPLLSDRVINPNAKKGAK